MRPRRRRRGEPNGALQEYRYLSGLQCGHGVAAVENVTCKTWRCKEYFQLQCGPGVAAVENAVVLSRYNTTINVASMRPRRRRRGEPAGQARRLRRLVGASMRPRRRRRGERPDQENVMKTVFIASMR